VSDGPSEIYILGAQELHLLQSLQHVSRQSEDRNVEWVFEITRLKWRGTQPVSMRRNEGLVSIGNPNRLFVFVGGFDNVRRRNDKVIPAYFEQAACTEEMDGGLVSQRLSG